MEDIQCEITQFSYFKLKIEIFFFGGGGCKSCKRIINVAVSWSHSVKNLIWLRVDGYYDVIKDQVFEHTWQEAECETGVHRWSE